MWERKTSVILFLIFLCAAFSHGESNSAGSHDVELILESNHSNKDVFYQARNCATDADCHHLGKCETVRDGGQKTCSCKKGTSGDFCETVDECAGELKMCGKLGDASCVFDVELEKAVCKCDNDSKTFVPDEERCMNPCTSHDQCGRYEGYCYHEIGNQTFCSCPWGMIGDDCEIVEWCYTKKVDCGVDNNATCTRGGKGTAYCKCDDPKLGFDYDEKVCKDCSGCGEHVNKAGDCSYRGGRRSCPCWLQYYTSEEGKCEDCKCGTNGYACSFENGTKVCKCFSWTSQKGDVCEKCDCGRGQSKCEFMGNDKVCTCKEGYVVNTEEDSKCIEMCNDTKPCQNGGQCVQNVCSCLNGTRGDLCEIVEYCKLHNDCRFGECVYNVTSQEGSCKCKEGSNDVFDDYSNFCRGCNCGSGMRSCSFKEGLKICDCNIPYAQQYGQCELCQCKSHSSPYECHFDGFEKICKCDKGYAQYEDDCKECDCGANGTCRFTYFGSKSCKCDKGYTEDNGICKECDCGENGYCRFNFEGKKICNCNENFQEYKGTCEACDCGANANCEILGYKLTQCTCRSGYAMLQGKCTACNCYPGTKCEFLYGKLLKRCICPEGYANDGESCKECDCKVKGAKCSLGHFMNSCICPEGYESVYDPSNILKSYCDDIDECKQFDVCPSSTKCVNSIGSYDCVCKEGYEDNALYDIKKDGCRDIDECVRNYKPCNSENAVCSNTIGSYECRCKYGYTLLKSYEEKMNMCLSDSRPWKTATIVVGCLSGMIMTVFILILITRKCRFR